MNIEPWNTDTARKLSDVAAHIFTNHVPHGPDDELERTHCAACGLARFDYAGWLRVYVQAGQPIPRAEFVRELSEARTVHIAYYDAILRDIATWGVTVK